MLDRVRRGPRTIAVFLGPRNLPPRVFPHPDRIQPQSGQMGVHLLWASTAIQRYISIVGSRLHIQSVSNFKLDGMRFFCVRFAVMGHGLCCFFAFSEGNIHGRILVLALPQLSEYLRLSIHVTVLMEAPPKSSLPVLTFLMHFQSSQPRTRYGLGLGKHFVITNSNCTFFKNTTNGYRYHLQCTGSH